MTADRRESAAESESDNADSDMDRGDPAPAQRGRPTGQTSPGSGMIRAVRRAAVVLGIAAILIAVLLASEANLNRNEPKCRYEGHSTFSCHFLAP
jgi:hypothetical protein